MCCEISEIELYNYVRNFILYYFKVYYVKILFVIGYNYISFIIYYFKKRFFRLVFLVSDIGNYI